MNPLRRVAALAVLALSASALVAAPADAADAPTLTWSFSDYLFNASHQSVGFTSHAVGAGATDGATGIVFGGGEGTGSLESGDLDVTYQGSVTFTWHADITFSDPEVVVDGDEGTIVADVSWAVPETGSADDVVLTTFDPATASLDGDTFTATPDWSAQTWDPELIAALPSSVTAFFYATGSSSDARKAPASFTAQAPADEAAPTVATKTSYDGTQVLVDVDGSGFTAVTNPGDLGVYVALGPAGGLPGDEQVDMDKFADAEWVMPAQMADGTFSVTLDPTNDVLDPSVQYAVYTWQAHSHSNPTQDTETPIEITWSKLAGPTALTAKVAKAPTTKKAGSLGVAVSGGESPAAGTVTVVLSKKGQKAKTLTGKVVGGAGTVKLPKLAKGTWSAKLSFLPSTAAYKSATKTVKVKVKAG